MIQLNLCGNIFGSSGYARHTRGLLSGLLQLGVEVKLDSDLPTGWEGSVTDEQLRCIQKPKFKGKPVIFVHMPHLWKQIMTEYPGSKYAGFVVWEGDKIPNCFMKSMMKAHYLLTPSQHVKAAIERVCKFQNLHIIPHGVQLEKYKQLDKPKKFTFIANKGWCSGIHDRGGIQWLLQAFTEEFKKDEVVCLRVKINPAYNLPHWNFEQEFKKLNLVPCGADIQICTEAVVDSEIPSFYRGHVFVSPTMAEAFSLPCLEAMACGIPVITTNYGGQLDYINNENGWLIESDPYPVVHDVMYEGVNWVKPRIEHLRKVMRHVYEHPEEIEEKVKKCVVTRLTWTESARKLLQVLGANDGKII